MMFDPILMNKVLTGMLESITELKQSGSASQPTSTYKLFRDFTPRTFSGVERGLEVDEWLSHIEDCLTLVNAPRDEWVDAARRCFTHSARDWWTALQARLKGVVLTWEEFRRLFEATYFPDIMKDELRQRFERLEQGQRTVDQYDAEFTRLSKYASELVDTEASRARRFRKGLHPAYRGAMSTADLTTHAAVLAAARRYEAHLRDIGKLPEARGQLSVIQKENKKGVHSRQLPELVQSVQFKKLGASCMTSKQLACRHCGDAGHAARHCKVGQRGLCYKCRTRGHRAKDCLRGPSDAKNSKARSV